MKKKIVIVSGLGIGAEHQLSSARDVEDIWEKYDVTQLATAKAFEFNPGPVLRFYNERRRMVEASNPNLAHIELVELESSFDVTIITQNIDDLHERAGSSNVLHFEGEVFNARSSVDPNLIYDTRGKDIKVGDLCEKGSQVRPNVVWFGEEPPLLQKAKEIISEADLMLVVGTSLAVYPFASLVLDAPIELTKIIISPDLENVPVNATIVKEDPVVAVPRIIEKWKKSGRLVE